jgi:hypothetical protein
VGIARRVDRGGRSWTVRSYRFAWPPWRAFWPEFEQEDPFGSPVSFLLNLLFAPVTLLVIPLLVYPLEVVVRLVSALFSPERWVRAVATGEPRIGMTWITDSSHEQAVVEQVARQLELGYSKIEPHRAQFVGFTK